MKVRKLNSDAILPTVAHPGEDLGFDIYALEDTKISDVTKVRTGISVEYPGMGFIIKDRSSIALRGILTHGGVIDVGYRGEIIVLMSCRTPFGKILKGEKIAQLVPVQSWTAVPIREVTDLSASERGSAGFGSTGG